MNVYTREIHLEGMMKVTELVDSLFLNVVCIKIGKDCTPWPSELYEYKSWISGNTSLFAFPLCQV